MFSTPITSSTQQLTSLELAQSRQPHALKDKIWRTWESFINCCLCCSPCIYHFSYLPLRSWSCPTPLEQRIKAKIKQIRIKERAFKQIEIPKISTAQMAEEIQTKSKAKRQEWLNSFHEAFNEAIQGLTPAEMSAPPRKITLLLTGILQNYGIALYNSSEAPHPFESSLNVLRAALIMQEYALGLRTTTIDLSQVKTLDTLHLNEQLRSQHQGQAEQLIAQLQPNLWAEKASGLSQRELFNLVSILRYTNGAMRYLHKLELQQSEKILYTAQECLTSALENPAYDQVELRDQLAELKYNELTGLFSLQIKEHSRNGQQDRADRLKKKLTALWSECIHLSKDPEKMRARCDNKRTFVEEMNPLEIAHLRQRALKRHLSLPSSRQDKSLIALAWNNLSVALADLGEEEAAYKAANMAMKNVLECRAKGMDDSQFKGVDRNYLDRCKKFIERQEKENARLQAIVQAACGSNQH